LLGRLLQRNPVERLTFEEFFQHPFLSGATGAVQCCAAAALMLRKACCAGPALCTLALVQLRAIKVLCVTGLGVDLPPCCLLFLLSALSWCAAITAHFSSSSCSTIFTSSCAASSYAPGRGSSDSCSCCRCCQ
jgi:hypothetical protein